MPRDVTTPESTARDPAEIDGVDDLYASAMSANDMEPSGKPNRYTSGLEAREYLWDKLGER